MQKKYRLFLLYLHYIQVDVYMCGYVQVFLKNDMTNFYAFCDDKMNLFVGSF